MKQAARRRARDDANLRCGTQSLARKQAVINDSAEAVVPTKQHDCTVG